MNEINPKVFSEVLEILAHTEDEVFYKIPKKFITFLIDNKDEEYEPTIDFSKDNWDDMILEDTKGLLALIYRDYITSPEEREQLIKEEEQLEEELREKYNPDNVFKNRKKEKEEIIIENNENTQLMVISELPWYKRLYQKILSFFGKKK